MMNNPPQTDWLDYPDFLSAQECEVLLALLERAEAPSNLTQTILAWVDTSQRKLHDLTLPAPVHQLLYQKLADIAQPLGAYFALKPPYYWEPLQFLCYQPGDYFRRHSDTVSHRPRQLSIVLYLSDPSTYCGGELRFYPPGQVPITLRPAAGTLVAFRPEWVHEVTPLQSGKRYSIATWLRTNRASNSL